MTDMTNEEFTALNRQLYAAGYPVAISNLPPPGLADLPESEQLGWLFSQNYDIAQVIGTGTVIWLRTEPGRTPAAIVPASLLARFRLTDSPASQNIEPVHCTYCGAEVEKQDTGLWETGDDTAGARRYCTDAPDHLHAGEATTCDRCGGRLIAGEGDARYCGPCTEVLADQLDAARDSEALKQIAATLASASSANEALTEIIVVMQRNDRIKESTT